ncbi:BrnA antitoxin family protein [Rhodopila globiformis]|nr:BrnA antitoxin family protein [Rhodopila globiformis]
MTGKAKPRAARRGGRPRLESPKTHISLRLDAAIVATVKASGKGYTSRVEQVLREAIAAGVFASQETR